MSDKTILKLEKEFLPAKRFVEFYGPQNGVQSVELVRLESDSKSKSPDYYLPELNSYLEVKELHDRDDVERFAQWGAIITKFKEYLGKSTLMEKVVGVYLVDTPPRFKYPSDPKSLEDAIERIVKAVLNSDKKVTLKNNVEFVIAKVGDKDSVIGFGSHGGGYYSPEQTIYNNVIEKIMVADEQIKNAPLKSKKGVVLLVNKYRQAEYMGHIYGGLALGIDRLIQIQNIDEIWIEQGGETKTYELLYERSFFENLINGNLLEDPKHLLLFEKWIFHFNNQKWQYHLQLFECLKVVLKNKRPDELFHDRYARQQMVRLGQPLWEDGNVDGVIWLIDKFIDDSNPSIVPVDGEKDFEKELLEGGSGDAITCVVGDVVWRVKELAWKQELIGMALDYIARLVQHESGYVKVHCTYALLDISSNRGWLKGCGVYPRIDEYKKFHEVAFYLLEFLKKHPTCTVLSRTLGELFKSYTDLTVEEASEVLEVCAPVEKCDGGRSKSVTPPAFHEALRFMV